MKKSDPSGDRLLSVGEVGRAIGVTRRMILNYEDRGLLRPDVKEGDAGNRYYTTDTLTRIRAIRVLQDLGLSLDEICDYFNDDTDLEPLIRRLEALRDELNLSIEKLRARAGFDGMNVQRVTLPRQTVYRRVFHSETAAQKAQYLRETMLPALLQYGSDTSKRMFFTEFPMQDPEMVSYCIAIPDGSEGAFVEALAEVPALCITYHGAYEELPAVRERIAAWAAEHHIPLTGLCRHIYLEGAPQHRDPRKFITQVALPIVERRRNG